MYFCTIWLIIVGIGNAWSFNTLEAENLIQYQLKWPGKSVHPVVKYSSSKPFVDEYDKLTVRTEYLNEKYECLIPNDQSFGGEQKGYFGSTGAELLMPLILQNFCVHKHEIYWSYEVCHGRHIRQYHPESRNGISEVTSEFILGTTTRTAFETYLMDLISDETRRRTEDPNNYLPQKNIDGKRVKYVEVKMEGGGICDMTKKPRRADILYICNPDYQQSIHSIKEKSTCYYEIIIKTSYLCDHPEFSSGNQRNLNIDCYALDDSPQRPYNLLKSIKKTKEFRKSLFTQLKGHLSDMKSSMEKEANILQEFEKSGLIDRGDKDAHIAKETNDDEKMSAFLSNKICLLYDSGYWKYRICHGKKITQFHIDDLQKRKTASILLGTFNQKEHVNWINENKERKPQLRAIRKEVQHYYSNGDKCSDGQRRHVIVNLVCPKLSNPLKTKKGTELRIEESEICNYVLWIESQGLCPFISEADDNTGLIHYFDLLS